MFGTLGPAPFVFLACWYGLANMGGSTGSEVGADAFLRPAAEDRNIRTVAVDWFFVQGAASRRTVSFYGGITAAAASGEITQLDGNFEDEVLDSPGNGIGPVCGSRWMPVSLGPLGLGLELNVGVLFYDRAFPAGGDRYNYMGRAGPTLTYALGRDAALVAGYRFMHVSNGQGEINHNPAYEAWGGYIGYERRLR